MSSCINAAPSEKLCYIPCNSCNIMLAVSVPCSNLLETVTVRCGHCGNLWFVNMAAAFQSSQDTQGQNYLPQNYPSNSSGSSSTKSSYKTGMLTATSQERVVNPPPEKKQRVASAYNQFIKEEIQRIKANNPDISHREAFSAAAKNWAHLPHIHFGLTVEGKNQPKPDGVSTHQITKKRPLRNL